MENGHHYHTCALMCFLRPTVSHASRKRLLALSSGIFARKLLQPLLLPATRKGRCAGKAFFSQLNRLFTPLCLATASLLAPNFQAPKQDFSTLKQWYWHAWSHTLFSTFPLFHTLFTQSSPFSTLSHTLHTRFSTLKQ